MQADFLLIANRADIDVSSAWNRQLLVAIPEAFLQAVQILNKGHRLRYTWTRYLSDRPPLSDFFEHLETGIRRSLSKAEIIESLSGDVVAPRKLKFVPTEFRDDQGMPLVYTERTVSKYMSPKYAVDDKATFILLGVQELTTSEFIDDLQSYISTAPETFQAMSSSWHSSLAEALIHAIHRDARNKARVADLAIIPLKDGRWVTSGRQQICFASMTEKVNIPRTISIGEIDPTAIPQSSRRSLYILLGARTYSKDLVCDAIVRAQNLPDFDPDALDASDLISHADFLFQAGWKNSGDHDLWVATEAGVAKRGSETFANSLKPHSAKALFNDMGARFGFLHRGYSEANSSLDESWMKWICEHLQVAEYPRLVLALSPKLVLAKDFRTLTEDVDPLRFLLLLRDRWDTYAQNFVPRENAEAEVESSKAKLREKMAALAVPCQGGGTCPLGQTVLPLTQIVSEDMNSTTFLQVPMPEDTRWKFLRHFGVIVDAGVSQYVQYLRQIKMGSEMSVKGVTEIYRQIQSHATHKTEEVK
jgi:hypothetical protein